jgi:hypothetical protein
MRLRAQEDANGSFRVTATSVVATKAESTPETAAASVAIGEGGAG